MRCSVSQTISSVIPEPVSSGAPRAHISASGGPNDDTVLFTTLLVDIALKPISEAIGELGSAVADEVAAQIARTAFTPQ